jgi:hypothetical protein
MAFEDVKSAVFAVSPFYDGSRVKPGAKPALLLHSHLALSFSPSHATVSSLIHHLLPYKPLNPPPPLLIFLCSQNSPGAPDSREDECGGARRPAREGRTLCQCPGLLGHAGAAVGRAEVRGMRRELGIWNWRK